MVLRHGGERSVCRADAASISPGLISLNMIILMSNMIMTVMMIMIVTTVIMLMMVMMSKIFMMVMRVRMVPIILMVMVLMMMLVVVTPSYKKTILGSKQPVSAVDFFFGFSPRLSENDYSRVKFIAKFVPTASNLRYFGLNCCVFPVKSVVHAHHQLAHDT